MKERISLLKWSVQHNVNSSVAQSWAIRGYFKSARREPDPHSPKKPRWMVDVDEPKPVIQKKMVLKRSVVC